MAKTTKTSKTTKPRVKVKDLPGSEKKKLTGKDLKKVKGGSSGSYQKWINN